jgi:transposase
MGTRRSFSREFKLSVLKELETKQLAEVCRAHNLAPSTIYYWRRDYEANPKEAFKGHGNIWKEDAKMAQYERLIGQLYAENAFLKKVYEKLKQVQAEEKRKERCSAR